MEDYPFVVRVVPSRRHKKSGHNPSYPETPAAYYEGYYPASGGAKANRVAFERRLQSLPELNSYPATPATGVQYLEPPGALRTSFKRRLLTPAELNSYPATPAGYYSGFYPGSALAKSFRSWFKQGRQDTPEHNTYPAPPTSDAPLTAFMLPAQFRRYQKRIEVRALEIDSYPEAPEAEAEAVEVTGGHYWPDEWRRKHKPPIEPGDWLAASQAKRKEFIKSLIIGVEDAPEPVKQAVKDEIAPFVPEKARKSQTIRAPQGKSLTQLIHSIERVERLIEIYAQYREDEETAALLLLH